MITAAKLTELIAALEEQSDSVLAYLDRETGEVFLMSDESLRLAGNEPEEIASLPDWQKEEAEVAVLIATTERYLTLPNRFEVNEWKIMSDFCDQVEPESNRLTLQDAIHGNQAFRRFKDRLGRLDLWNSWNQFRSSAFEDILREWCEDHEITLLPDPHQTKSRQSSS